MRRLLCLALAAAAPATLAVSILVGSTPDEEEFRFAILASTMHMRTLADGTFAWWSSALGLGIPQPLVPNFHMHPLAPLLATMSPVTWVRLLYLAQTIVGAIGMWQLGRALRLTPLTRAACVFSFLLATPTQNYLVTDFWPSHYLVWTSAPWLLLFAWRFLETSGRDSWRRGLILGVTAGLVLSNTNPGHVVVYAAVALAVVAVRARAFVTRWRSAVVLSAIALAIAGPNLLQLAAERTIFDEGLGIEKYREPLPPSATWDVFLRPLSRSGDPWQADVVANGTRTLFFGGPFAVLALTGLWLGRAHRDLVLGVLIGGTLLFTPWLPITFASRFHFRDPLALCAIPLAGLVLDRLLRSRRTQPIAAAVLVVQIAAVGAAAWPFLERTWTGDARDAMWFHGATGDTGLVDRLVASMPESGRLVYSPRVDYEMSERGLVVEGLGVNALAYRGVPVVNGSFKGVSTDVLWPDDRLFYGRIRIPAQLIESDEGLDVLGIRYVLAYAGEAVAPGFIERVRLPTRRSNVLVLYENRDSWPGAFAIRGNMTSLAPLPLYADCSNNRLLCKDLRTLANRRQPGPVHVTRQEGAIDVAVGSDTEPRLLVIAEMFRPDWRATAAGEELTTASVGPGLLGVRLPPGTTSVRLDYRPMSIILANVLAWSALAGGLIGIFALSRPRARRTHTNTG